MMFDASQNTNYKTPLPYNSINNSYNIQISLFRSLDRDSQRLLKSLLKLLIEQSNHNIFWYDIIFQIITNIPIPQKSFLKDKVLINTAANLYNQISLDIDVNKCLDKNFCIIGATLETRLTGLVLEHARLGYPKILLLDLPITRSPTSIYDYGISIFSNFNKNESFINRIISLDPQILISVKPMDEDLSQHLLKSGIIALSDVSLPKVKLLSKYLQCEIISRKHQLQSDKMATCKSLEIQFTHNDMYMFTFGGFKDLFVSTLYLTETNAKEWAQVQKVFQRIISFLEYVNFEASFVNDYGVKCSSTLSRKKILDFDKAFLEKFYANEYSLSPYVNMELPFPLNECIKSWNLHVSLAVQQFNAMTNKDQHKILLKDKKVKMHEDFPEEYVSKIADFLINQISKDQKNQLDNLQSAWENFKLNKPNLLSKFPLLETCFLYYTHYIDHGKVLSNNFCQNPIILSLEYYSPANDLSIEDFINQEVKYFSKICENCNQRFSNHQKSYIRNNSKLTIIVKKNVAEWFDNIHVWNKQYTGKTSERKKLSNNSKLFSFAKLLDLMLSPKSCLKFENITFNHHPFERSILCFGLRDRTVEIQSSMVKIYSIDNNLDKCDDKVICINNKNEGYISIRDRVENMFSSIYERIWSMGVFHKRILGGNTQMEIEIKAALNFIELDKQKCLDELLNVFINTHVTDSVSMNPIIFKLQQLCAKWNKSIQEIESKLSNLDTGKSFEDSIKDIPPFKLLTYLYMNSGRENDHYELENYETSMGDDLTVETFSSDDVDYSFSTELEAHREISSELCELASTGLPEQYVSKVSMVPKLKVKTNAVKEKISQMEALISGKSAFSNPKSPSLKSPLSDVSSSSFNKDLIENKAKVAELKIYFDDLQNKFTAQLEEKKKKEKKLRNNKRALGIFRDHSPSLRSSNHENSDLRSLNSRIVDYADQIKSLERFSNFSACGEISFNDTADETICTECDSDIGYEDFNETAPNIIKERTRKNVTKKFESKKRGSAAVSKGKDFDDKNLILDLFKKFMRNKYMFLNPIESPLDFSEHISPGSCILLHDDQPSSFISFTLLDTRYLHQLSDSWEAKNHYSSQSEFLIARLFESTIKDCNFGFSIKDGLDFSCKVYFVEQFEAFREKCGIDGSIFAYSLSSCVKFNETQWKTKDCKYYLTELSKDKVQFLLSVLSEYFSYFAEILFNGAPSFLSKIFGIYTVETTNNITGEKYEKHLVVTENITQIDCETTKLSNTLLEEVAFSSSDSPIFMRYKSSKLFKSSLLNDIAFFESINICGISLEIQKKDSETRILCATNLLDAISAKHTTEKIVATEFLRETVNKIDHENEKIENTTSKDFIKFIENLILAVPDEWHL